MDIDTKSWAPKLARNVLRNTLGVKEGETLTIEAWPRALPWLDAFLIEARKTGVHPMVIYESESAYWTNIDQGRSESLGKIGAQEWAALKESNAYVFFWGPADRIRWHKLSDATLKSLTAYEEEWFKIMKDRGMRMCRLELSRATEELAQQYGISYSGWVRELLEASTLDPKQMVREGRKISATLERGSKVLISHSNGTKLELRLKGRKPYVDDGVVDEADVKAGFGESTVPSGVVMVAVDEEFAEGRFNANRPTRFGPSKGLTDQGRWDFENCRLAKFKYAKGEKEFNRLYVKAGPERDRIGILTIGLNPKIRDSPLFEDQERGVVTIYVGVNEWLGGANKGEFRTWLVLRGADVTVDGEPLLRAGKIV